MCPQTEVSEDASLRRCVTWTTRPLNIASLGHGVSDRFVPEPEPHPNLNKTQHKDSLS